MITVCVTGCMAAGKNAASDILEKNGFISLDADKVVHQILLEREFQEKVITTFESYANKSGINLRNSDGTLNRRNLGAIIFKDKKLLALQESIILPEVDRRIYDFVDKTHAQNKNAVINATVLYKISSIRLCNFIIFVTAPFITRFKRAKKRDGIKSIQILQRFFSQLNLFSKYKKSNADTFKVSNSGSLENLENKINEVLIWNQKELCGLLRQPESSFL